MFAKSVHAGLAPGPVQPADTQAERGNVDNQAVADHDDGQQANVQEQAGNQDEGQQGNVQEQAGDQNDGEQNNSDQAQQGDQNSGRQNDSQQDGGD